MYTMLEIKNLVRSVFHQRAAFPQAIVHIKVLLFVDVLGIFLP